MLRSRWIAVVLLLLGGCESDAPPVREPSGTLEANYRLLYNGTLVGNALFVVEIGDDGAYRVDAFTVPAGKMLRATAHEVLETSSGRLDANGVRPSRFEESVLKGDDYALASLAFDWERRRLAVSGPQGRRDLALLPDTHDRLSYLLAARRLAVAGEGSALLQVASTDASEETRLVVEGRAAVAVPLGNFDAVVVRRVTADAADSRRLWFAPAHHLLPLRVLQQREGNTVDMQIESLSRRSSDPR
ncbi:MAG: DUF3108 domain-containing protein [Gammaproteobacteria bacterium]|nr:DUF3108 domain-containing protein [Gammaproteobacteria bacterium]